MEDKKIKFSDILKEIKGSKDKATKALINEYEKAQKKAQKKQKETSEKLKKAEKEFEKEDRKLWAKYGVLQKLEPIITAYREKGKSADEAIVDKYNCFVDYSKRSATFPKYISVEKLQEPGERLQALSRMGVYQYAITKKYGQPKIDEELTKLENKWKKIELKLDKAKAKSQVADELVLANKQNLVAKYRGLQGKEEKNQSTSTQERLDQRTSSAVSKSNSFTQGKTKVPLTHQNDLQK